VVWKFESVKFFRDFFLEEIGFQADEIAPGGLSQSDRQPLF
jgi:hypothetical protein